MDENSTDYHISLKPETTVHHILAILLHQPSSVEATPLVVIRGSKSSLSSVVARDTVFNLTSTHYSALLAQPYQHSYSSPSTLHVVENQAESELESLLGLSREASQVRWSDAAMSSLCSRGPHMHLRAITARTSRTISQVQQRKSASTTTFISIVAAARFDRIPCPHEIGS